MANNNNSMTEEERVAWYKNIFYPKMVRELNSNNALLSEYKAFKSALSSLKANLEDFKTNIKDTHQAVLNAVSFDGFESSIEKLNDYKNSVSSSISSIDTVIAEVNKKITELETRNNEIRTQIRV